MSTSYNDTYDESTPSLGESSVVSDCPDFVPYAYDDDENDSYYGYAHSDTNKKDKSKSADPGLKVFIRYNQIGTKIGKIRAYETVCIPGKYIRDAITGVRTQYKAGSADEDLFFSVCMATGQHGGEPVFLFFDSPEQYERTFYSTISAKTKEEWSKRFNARRQHNSDMAVARGAVVVK